MDEVLKKIQAAKEKTRAKMRELNRKERERISVEKGKASREDTRRKVLAGSWAFDVASRDPKFKERMETQLDKLWLVRDDDRRIFGLPALTEEQKAAHPNAHSLGGKKGAAASDTQSQLRDLAQVTEHIPGGDSGDISTTQTQAGDVDGDIVREEALQKVGE